MLWPSQESSAVGRGTLSARPPVVPGYVTEELLGLGSTGEVWAARAEPSGQSVALKRLRVAAGHGVHAELRREGSLLTAFRHPHVVALHGLRRDGEGLVLVLERAATSLAALVEERGRLSAAEAVGVGASIADALAAAHAKQLVHGDVAPGNVLLRFDGHPLLADLGTARLVSACDPNPAGIPFGTPGFSDPALSAGAAVRPTSDVYSLAAVMVYALTGQAMRDQTGAVQQWADLAHAARIPPGLVSAVCDALVAQPDARVPAAEFGRQLRAVVSPTAVVVPRLRCSSDRTILPVTCPPRAAEVSVSAAKRLSSGGEVTGRRSPASMPTVTRRRLIALLIAVVTGVGTVILGHTAWAAFGADLGAERVAKSRDRHVVAAGEWAAAMTRLDAVREEAFATANIERLRNVYAPDSPMYPSDERQIRALQSATEVVLGVRHRFSSVRLVEQNSATATVHLTEQLEPHTVVWLGSARDGSAPTVVRAVAAGKRRTATVRFRKMEGQLRIVSVD